MRSDKPPSSSFLYLLLVQIAASLAIATTSPSVPNIFLAITQMPIVQVLICERIQVRDQEEDAT